MNTPPHSATESPLRLRDLYANRRLVVIGGTGFLGKVWWSLLLDRLPEVGKLFLVVRSKPNMSSAERFWQEIAPHPCLAPLAARYGEGYRAFLEEKVVPVEGDITQPFCGLSEPLRRELEGTIDAVVNASGIVNFQPPLDVALEVNAFGAQTVVDLARDLGGVGVVHTSTCYVAGYRPGIVEETHPLEHPFPFAGKLERAHWDADREIAECLDIIKQAKQRAGDAFRQSHFLDQAKRNLIERGEPSSGRVLEEEIERVRRRFVEIQLAQLGQERAQFWGWPNTYTYTKSIGEQIIARSGLPFTIVRPAIIESCVEYPSVGWNEGVNTSAPIIYAIRQGQQQLPGDSVRLDLIPCDFVASGMLLSLAELLEGRAKPVYQYGTSDSNPVTMSRVYELSGLHKRKLYKRTGQGGPVVSFLQAHLEGALLEPQAFEAYGPKRVAAVANGVAGWLEGLPEGGLSLSLEPAAVGLRKFARKQENIAKVVGQFIPFTAELDYEFRCDNTRAAFARTLPEEQTLLYWHPEQLDWREWFLGTHIPGLDKWVFPELESKLRKRVKALRHHDTLVHLIEEMAERHDLAVALQDASDDGLTRVSFREWRQLASACAERLQRAGVQPGTAVALLAGNQSNWAIALFGILLTGAKAVLLDPHALPKDLSSQLRSEAADVVIHGPDLGSLARRLPQPNRNVTFLELAAACEPLSNCTYRPGSIDPDQVAVVAFSRGTADSPRAIHFTHGNLVRLVAATAPLFPVSHKDRFLNVLPLTRPPELVCGLLLPLSRGARVVFTPRRDPASLLPFFRTAHITAIVAGPVFWDGLVAALCDGGHGGALKKRWLKTAFDLSSRLKRGVGLEAGPLLLSSVHSEFGGHLRFLVNTGAPLNPETRNLLLALGLRLSNCYGTADAGALAVATVRPGNSRESSFDTVVPGVTLRIGDEDATGLGELLAKGETLPMTATAEAPWLRTGDLGTVDARGRWTLVCRRADAIRATDGTWVHLGMWRERLRALSDVSEMALIPSTTGASGASLIVVPRERLTPEAIPVWQRRITGSVEVHLAELPQEHRPTNVHVYNAPLPRGQDGDIDHRALRDAIARELGDVRGSTDDGVSMGGATETPSVTRRRPSLHALQAFARRLNTKVGRRGRSSWIVEN